MSERWKVDFQKVPRVLATTKPKAIGPLALQFYAPYRKSAAACGLPLL